MRDLEAVLGAVGELALLESGEVFPELALAHARALIACDQASYNEVQLATGRAHVVSSPMVAPTPAQLAEFGRLVHQNPVVSHHMRTRDGTAVRFSDFMTLRELKRTELHASVYREIGVNRQLACTLHFDPIVGLALSREGRDFSERDRSVLELMRPHLSAGFRRWRLAAQPIVATDDERAERLAGLTAREREIATLVARGATNAEVALALMLAPKTVNAHLERIFRKLDVHRRSQLAWLLGQP